MKKTLREKRLEAELVVEKTRFLLTSAKIHLTKIHIQELEEALKTKQQFDRLKA